MSASHDTGGIRLQLATSSEDPAGTPGVPALAAQLGTRRCDIRLRGTVTGVYPVYIRRWDTHATMDPNFGSGVGLSGMSLRQLSNALPRVAVLGLLLVPCACASSEATRAKTVAQSNLMCSPAEMHAGVERQTPNVREWYVGCDFTYTRVHCSDGGCVQAEPKPPCLGDLRCFEEDPVTLRWELAPEETTTR